jgi:hypothetical protein
VEVAKTIAARLGMERKIKQSLGYKTFLRGKGIISNLSKTSSINIIK